MSATHALGASVFSSSKAITLGARHIRRPTAAQCRSMMPENNNTRVQSATSNLRTTSESWEKQVLLIATICPLACMFPTTAQAAALASAGLAEDFTVPLLVTTLVAGAVFGVLNDKGTKRVLEEQVSGISGTTRERSGDTTLASTSSPTQAQQEVLQAAVAEVPASSSSLLAASAEALAPQAPQTPSEILQKRVESAGAVLATSTVAVTDNKVTAAPIAAPEFVDTQVEALPILEAKAVEVAASSDVHATSDAAATVPVAAAAVTTTPKAPMAPALIAPTAAAAKPAGKQQRGESIFDLAAETARRMQVEYENKVAAIKAEGERRREAEVRRRQQRYAALDRLQAAAATQASAESSAQEHSQGPLARLMALFMALWAWLKERFDAVFTHTSNSSSAASA